MNFDEAVTYLLSLGHETLAMKLGLADIGRLLEALGNPQHDFAGARTVALTPIAMDHQEYLGETLAEIASEKAAIIRPGTNVITGPQLPEALAVILRQCDAAGVTPRLVESAGADTCTVIAATEDG